MRRISLFGSVVAVALLGLLAAGGPPALDAHDATPTAAETVPIVTGSWLVQGPGPIGALVAAVYSFTAHGLLIVGDVRGNMNQGAWAASGERTANFTIVDLLPNDAYNLGALLTIRGTVEVAADARSLRLAGTYEESTPDGAVLASHPFAVEGTRIVPEPPASPTTGTLSP